MTNEQKEQMRLLLAKLLEEISKEEWRPRQIVLILLRLERFIDSMIDDEVIQFLNSQKDQNEGTFFKNSDN